jgi:long-chain acyl-CoA synthetase
MIFPMNIASAFCAVSERSAGKTAVFWGEAEVSYRDLWAQSRALGGHLSGKLSVRPGERVGLWLRNCPEFIPSFLGILEAGGVVVPINNFLKPDEVGGIIQDAGIQLLITDATMAEGTARLAAAHPGLRTWMVDDLAGLRVANSGTETSSCSRGSADLAVIIYTSGTTGRPKGAMLSHGNLLHNVESCRRVLEAVDVDRFVVLLPLFHSFMMTVGMLLPLLVGGSMVLVKSLHPPKNILHEILRRDATILPAVPQFFRTLAGAALPPQLPLRICISGGAPLPVEILREFEKKLPIPLIEGYGLSEASPVVSMNPIHGVRKAGSIGRPIPDVEVSVQDEQGAILADGQTGEVCIRGGNVMLGYWNQPEETARALRGGWLLTGDVGHRDDEGYFFITDRKKDMFIVNGINVYPREVEEVIYRFPGVKEAAVIGVPDARRGEQSLAFVAPGEGASLDQKALLHFMRDKLADYKVPRRVVFLQALPRNATGKVLKTALRQMESSGGVAQAPS